MGVPEFGKPWAERGDIRIGRWRTPLAWVAGVGEGVLLVQYGGDASGRRWLLMSEWSEWVSQGNAKPAVEPDPESDPPWSDDPA